MPFRWLRSFCRIGDALQDGSLDWHIRLRGMMDNMTADDVRPYLSSQHVGASGGEKLLGYESLSAADIRLENPDYLAGRNVDAITRSQTRHRRYRGPIELAFDKPDRHRRPRRGCQ